ncbi:MAG: T9SS type A sorting domain-containing protein [Saprospiraceae bacterium]
MKKIFCIPFMLILGCGVFAQDPVLKYLKLSGGPELNLKQVLDEGDTRDSSLAFLWDTDLHNWLPALRHIFEYDANKNLTADYVYDYNGTDWQNARIGTFEYDQDNHETYDLTRTWDGANFIDETQTFSTYDADGNLIHLVYQRWVDTVWENSLQIDYVYGADHHRISSTSQIGVNGVLKNYSHLIYTYSNGKLESYINQSWDQEDGWVNSRQYSYEYEADTLKKYLVQTWLMTDWHDSYRVVYEYDTHGNNTLLLNQKALGGDMWENDYQNVFEYDGMDDLIYEAYQDYVNNVLENSAQFFYTNDSRHNRLTVTVQYWSGDWENSDSTHYYYNLASGIKNIPARMTDINIYPNPSTNILNIETSTSNTGELNISFITNEGVSAIESIIRPFDSKTIDVSKLIPGSYHILIQSDKGIAVKEFIKL